MNFQIQNSHLRERFRDTAILRLSNRTREDAQILYTTTSHISNKKISTGNLSFAKRPATISPISVHHGRAEPTRKTQLITAVVFFFSFLAEVTLTSFSTGVLLCHFLRPDREIETQIEMHISAYYSHETHTSAPKPGRISFEVPHFCLLAGHFLRNPPSARAYPSSASSSTWQLVWGGRFVTNVGRQPTGLIRCQFQSISGRDRDLLGLILVLQVRVLRVVVSWNRWSKDFLRAFLDCVRFELGRYANFLGPNFRSFFVEKYLN